MLRRHTKAPRTSCEPSKRWVQSSKHTCRACHVPRSASKMARYLMLSSKGKWWFTSGWNKWNEVRVSYLFSDIKTYATVPAVSLPHGSYGKRTKIQIVAIGGFDQESPQHKVRACSSNDHSSQVHPVEMAMSQNPCNLVNSKIAGRWGRWMFIPPKWKNRF